MEKDLSDLLLSANLAASHPGDAVRLVARADVLSALPQLDPEHKRDLVVFLSATNLISGRQPIVNLSEADLSQANLSNMDLSQMNMSGANLSEVNLSHARLVNAELAQTIFVGADLTQADATGANLSHSNLTNARCSSANLEGADFQGASLSHALLDHADLFRARNAQLLLQEASTLSLAQLPDGTHAHK